MTYALEVDAEGKIALPDTVRRAHDIHAGRTLFLSDNGSESASLSFATAEDYAGLRLEQGMWVIDDDTPVTVEDTLRDIALDREERLSRI